MADDIHIITLDCRLKNVIVDPNMLKSITSMDKKITEILWLTSIISNYIILYLLDNNIDIPPLDRTFFFTIIYGITDPERKLAPKTQLLYDLIKPAITDYKALNHPTLDRENCSDILEVIINDNFVLNTRLSIVTNFFNIQKSYMYVKL